MKKSILNFSNTKPPLSTLSDRFFISDRKSLIKAVIATPQGPKLNPDVQPEMQLYQVDNNGELVKAEVFDFDMVKVLVVGDINTKKQELIYQAVNDGRSKKSNSSIGIDFSLLVLEGFCETSLKLTFWDIAGQERFGHMTRTYYKDSFFAFVVINAKDERSKPDLKWKSDLDANKHSLHRKFFSILLVNTFELSDDQYQNFSLENWVKNAKSEGYANCFHVDSKRAIKMLDAIKFAVNTFAEIPTEENQQQLVPK